MRTRDGFHSGASLLPVIIKPSSHISDREKSYDEGKEIMIREVLPDLYYLAELEKQKFLGKHGLNRCQIGLLHSILIVIDCEYFSVL